MFVSDVKLYLLVGDGCLIRKLKPCRKIDREKACLSELRNTVFQNSAGWETPSRPFSSTVDQKCALSFTLSVLTRAQTVRTAPRC